MDINPNIYLYLIYDKNNSKSQEGKMDYSISDAFGK